MTKVIELEKLTEVDESEFKEWFKNPITQMMLSAIGRLKETTKNSLLFEIDFRVEGVNHTLYNKGIISVCELIEKYDYIGFNDVRQIYIEEKQNDVKTTTSRYDCNSRD
jgi:hypothetical protein